jgi:hypothetical protein
MDCSHKLMYSRLQELSKQWMWWSWHLQKRPRSNKSNCRLWRWNESTECMKSRRKTVRVQDQTKNGVCLWAGRSKDQGPEVSAESNLISKPGHNLFFAGIDKIQGDIGDLVSECDGDATRAASVDYFTESFPGYGTFPWVFFGDVEMGEESSCKNAFNDVYWR